jgi:hypothetical protein
MYTAHVHSQGSGLDEMKIRVFIADAFDNTNVYQKQENVSLLYLFMIRMLY